MFKRIAGLTPAVTALLLAGSAVAQTAAPEAGWMTAQRDWGQALRADATAIHDAIIDSHPGVYDEQNPGFRAQVDRGLVEAETRAATTTDAGGWWWALRAYVATFDDGHVQLGLSDQQGSGFPTRWPGFLTAYRNGQAVVATAVEDEAGLPPVGARLQDCDGVPADRLAAERIGVFRGRWFLESQRLQFGDWLFMNASNPFTPEMRECRFEVDGATRAYALDWRPIESGPLSERRNAANRRGNYEFGMRRLDSGAFWLSMPSFDGTPDGEPARALTALLAEAEASQNELRAARYVVLDLRGNGGGSSHWSERLALTLWGDRYLRQNSLPPIEAIEWRASEANLAAIREFEAELTAAGATDDDERMRWARLIIAGMEDARAAGQPYWRDREGPVEHGPAAALFLSPVRGPVYVLTDAGCGSACLDAVDVWKAAGAIQVGRETSADTVYMDIREQALPTGLARMWIPMKVWRGRARGNNEPQRPVHAYDGDLTDTAAVEAWIAGLR